MAKRARPEEDSAGAASEEIETHKLTDSGAGTVVAKAEPTPVGRTITEGEAGTSEEGIPAHVAAEGMPWNGPFWELLALAGYKPW